MIQLYVLAGTALAAALVGGTGAWKVQSWRFAAKEARAAKDVAAWERRSRELQRASEMRYTVQAGVREKVIVETIVEVRHAAQDLAACPVPDRARSLLNDAARCARGDSAAACGDGEPVPVAR